MNRNYTPGPIDRHLELNGAQNEAVGYLVKSMGKTSLDQMSTDDIGYIQAYLERVKASKMKIEQPNAKYCMSVGMSRYNSNYPINAGHFIGKNPDYVNPYEYGGKQNEMGSIYKSSYDGPYSLDRQTMDEMGMNSNVYKERFPGEIRNVNVESVLWQQVPTHLPGQRKLTEKEINRFDLLPFDPQDTRHIVWCDDMPRGGYPTRTDRLEQNS